MPKIVLIGGSAGSIDALKVILQGLPKDFLAAVLVVVHIGARESVLPRLLERCSALPVHHALQGEPILPGMVLVAPPDLHLTVARDGASAYARLSRGPRENHSRPALDPLFRSAAILYGADAIAVVLSGFLNDGTVGLQAIKACGGIAVVQDPQDAEAPDMPASAIAHTAIDIVRPGADIAPALVELVSCAAAPARDNTVELRDRVAIENRMFDQGGAMTDMDQIGSRVALTCPECGGAIWEIRHSSVLRYRCHTGHAFTARVLESLQGGQVEESLWAAVRALHEQEQLFRQMFRKLHALQTVPPGKDDPVDEYLAKADRAAEHAQLLRDLIMMRMQTGRASL
jgi:two-component system chemotaxis response regulator CheB